MNIQIKFFIKYIFFLLLLMFFGMYTYNNFCLKTKDLYIYTYEKLKDKESSLYICINNIN